MDIDNLSDEDLRRRLLEFGQDDVPPITDTTRKLLRRRLQKLIIAAPAIAKPSNSTKNVPTVHKDIVPARNTTGKTAAPPTATTAAAYSSSEIGRRTRSGAAFSSDEEESGSLSSRKRNGESLVKKQITPSSASQSSSSSSSVSGGLSSWFNRGRNSPKTSTPEKRRTAYNFQDSFGATITPIRDDIRARRPMLARPPLESFSEEKTDYTKGQKGFMRRFLPDPIHLTPQPKEDRHVRHDSPHPRPIRFTQHKDDPTAGPRRISWALITFVTLFFAGVGIAYWQLKWNAKDISTMHFQVASRSPADVLRLCMDINKGLEPPRKDSPCYNEEEILAALSMGAALSRELARAKGARLCGANITHNMRVADARSFAIEAVSGSTALDFNRAVDLIVANPHWGIRALNLLGDSAQSVADVETFDSDYATKTWMCQIKEALSSALFKCFLIALVIMIIVGVGFFLRRYHERRQLRQVQVYESVNKIIDAVRKKYELSLKDPKLPEFVVVSHLREDFAPHGRQRRELLSLWEEAVKYIGTHESRISLSHEFINGEEFEVWRWLPTQVPQVDQSGSQEADSQTESKMQTRTSVSDIRDGVDHSINGKTRVWGGGANPRVTVPEHLTAATPCLKVRGMFNGKSENQTDLSWTQDVEDAILEKCHGVAQILDMRVEPQSEEGIIYIKLATNEDARNAYLALHGQYFDGTLLNVKFLKLERYHLRFPDAVGKKIPLQASKFNFVK